MKIRFRNLNLMLTRTSALIITFIVSLYMNNIYNGNKQNLKILYFSGTPYEIAYQKAIINSKG